MKKNKVILILIDGMRPDGLAKSCHPFLDELTKISSYTFDAKTVFPSMTLPCHISLFHSIPPQRHGTLSNTFAIPVRPVNGLFEQLKMSGRSACMYYSWEQLRDVSMPGSLDVSELKNCYSSDDCDTYLTGRALSHIKAAVPDFVFLYMHESDSAGHGSGWMSDEYIKAIYNCINNAEKVIKEVSDSYSIIITADHGGHDRIHGTEEPEDMTIPMFFCGDMFERGKKLNGISILDIIPTIADIMEIPCVKEWEGKSVINIK